MLLDVEPSSGEYFLITLPVCATDIAVSVNRNRRTWSTACVAASGRACRFRRIDRAPAKPLAVAEADGRIRARIARAEGRAECGVRRVKTEDRDSESGWATGVSPSRRLEAEPGGRTVTPFRYAASFVACLTVIACTPMEEGSWREEVELSDDRSIQDGAAHQHDPDQSSVS